jgi:hypothetical protein
MSFIAVSPGGREVPATPSSASRREAGPAGGAAIPGAADRDGTGHRVDRLVPVIGEFRLVAMPARYPRAVLARISGQQLAQHAPAKFQQPGAEHLPGGLQPALAA